MLADLFGRRRGMANVMLHTAYIDNNVFEMFVV